MINVLFLCTGNSCRSQMAEGFAKSLQSEKYRFYSAGTTKHGLNPFAIRVMQESGIDISKHESNTLDDFTNLEIDILFTVCSDADQNCPLHFSRKVIHIGFDDPPLLAKDITDEEQVLDIYRRVRDEIKEFIFNIDRHLFDLASNQ